MYLQITSIALYALFLSASGWFAWYVAGSHISFAMAQTFSVLLLYAMKLLTRDKKRGLSIARLCSWILLATFGIRTYSTTFFSPAGLMLVLTSLFAATLYINKKREEKRTNLN